MKNKIIEVHIETISSYSFEGYIFQQDLSNAELLMLGMRRLYKYPLAKIKVEGIFRIEWDDDIAMPQIDTITAIGVQDGTTYGPTGKMLQIPHDSGIPTYKMQYGEIATYKTLDINPECYNYEALETEICESEHYGDWQADRQGRLTDAAMDYFEDR